MKVILAKNSGFCPGVKRAVDTAKKIYGENVCILGEIIHNPEVNEQIAALGIKNLLPEELKRSRVEKLLDG